MSPEYILAMTYDLLLLRFTGGRAKASLREEWEGKKEQKQEPKNKTRSYDNPEEFEQARRKAMRGQ